MSQDYGLRFPPVRASREQLVQRLWPLLTHVGARFQGHVTVLTPDDEEGWRFGMDERQAKEPLVAIQASADWKGIKLSLSTNFGYMSLLIWNEPNSSASGFELWEESSVFGAQSESPETCDLFENLALSMAEQFNLNSFALTRDPLISSLPPDWIPQALAKSPHAPNGSELISAGLKMSDPQSANLEIDPDWDQSTKDAYRLFREPSFGVPSEDL